MFAKKSTGRPLGLLAVLACAVVALLVAGLPVVGNDTPAEDTATTEARSAFLPLLQRPAAEPTPTDTPLPTATASPSVTATLAPTATPTEGGGGGTVYITESGEKYHRADCRYLYGGATPVSCSWATANGYTACAVCKPSCP